MPEAPDYFGTRLIHGVNALLSAAQVTAAGNGSASFPTVAVNRPGYLIRVDANYSGAAPTNPFTAINVSWLDDTGTVTMAEEQWIIPVSISGTSCEISGDGPTKGQYCLITVTNLDTTVSVTVTITLLETTHHIARDDWRQMNMPAIPGQTLAPFAFPRGGILIAAVGGAFSVPAHTQFTYLLPLYAGQVWFNFLANTALQIDLITALPILQAPGNPGIILWQDTSLTAIQIDLVTPRVPCALQVNNQSAAAITFAICGAILEFAS